MHRNVKLRVYELGLADAVARRDVTSIEAVLQESEDWAGICDLANSAKYAPETDWLAALAQEEIRRRRRAVHEANAERKRWRRDRVFVASVDDGAASYLFVVLAPGLRAAQAQAKAAYRAEKGDDVDNGDLLVSLTEVDPAKGYHFFR
jgi:hypothetical protein